MNWVVGDWGEFPPDEDVFAMGRLDGEYDRDEREDVVVVVGVGVEMMLRVLLASRTVNGRIATRGLEENAAKEWKQDWNERNSSRNGVCWQWCWTRDRFIMVSIRWESCWLFGRDAPIFFCCRNIANCR